MANKYYNRQTEHLGHKFDSQKEANRYQELLYLERAGHIANIELQPRYDLTVNGSHICYYFADFRYVEIKTGLTVVEDVKGFRTKEYVLKKKLLKALYGVDVVEV